MKKRASSAAALLGAVALWVTLDQTAIPPGSTADETEEDFTQTYLSDAVVWQFDDMGTRTSRIAFQHAAQPSIRPVIQLEQIQHTGLYDGKPWHSTAGTGVLWDNNSRLNLDDGVVIEVPDTGTKLDALHLIINLTEQTARSGGPVTLISTDSTTTGTGLDVDLIQGTMKLRSNVTTTFVPPPVASD